MTQGAAPVPTARPKIDTDVAVPSGTIEPGSPLADLLHRRLQTMDVLGFINDNGSLKAIVSLTGTINPASGPAQRVTGAVVLEPVRNAAATGLGDAVPSAGSRAAVAQVAAGCKILHLDLGPLDLNLLGLAVHLDEVVLDITAVPGAGNLLGNLLCAVANLLNGLNLNLLGSALLNVLTTLLNNLVGALAGL